MRSKEKLWDICMDIYREMYIHSTPTADFDKLISNGVTKNPMWFTDYILSLEKSESIINKHCTTHKLTKYEKSRVSQELYLGCSPKFE